jgi:glycosyltransferase involved in cell wall biosynthesis
VHDFAGHPFQVQLSRELAQRGHSVLHLYLEELPGPKGRLAAAPADPATFRCAGVSLGAPFAKYSMVKRHWAHRKYARKLKDEMCAYQPDVVLSANTPIDVQHELLASCRQRGVTFVHWMQDLYCMALRSVLTQKLGVLGAPVAGYYDRLERVVCEHSHAVVFITADFQTAILEKGFRHARSHVIENWAPLDDVIPAPKCNSWSARHDLTGKLVFLYSGTLGLKHKPEILYRLAEALRDQRDAVVVAVTEGLGRECLEQLQQRRRLDNLRLMDFQPYSEISEVLGAADVLLGVIDREAGAFAVPSKVLSYLCAGRTVLLAAPPGNLAARTLKQAQAGVTVDPDDIREFVSAARWLAGRPDVRQAFAANARRYALETFNIQIITAKFEAVLSEAMKQTALNADREALQPSYGRVAAG